MNELMSYFIFGGWVLVMLIAYFLSKEMFNTSSENDGGKKEE